jgi:SWI/SNF-related matrix-associated actin-dependent regulator of chromatin subfamily A3
MFTWDCVWGLTATPSLETERAQHLYLLLAREKAHHPNLLAQIIQHGVHRHSPSTSVVPSPVISLKLVHLSAEERFILKLGETANVADIVRRCTVGAKVEEVDVLRRASLQAKLEGYERSVRIMEHVAHELENELERLTGGDNTDRVEQARRACDLHEKDLQTARTCRDAERRRLHNAETSDRLLQERLTHIATSSAIVCELCETHKCDSLVTCCSHMFCKKCVVRHLVCPHCKATLSDDLIVNVPNMNGVHSKLTEIGQLIVALQEPVILFVQWKSMVRSTRSFLLSLGSRVLLLDGNTAQRMATLNEFLSAGVLLLCLEESFSGLHLPHVRQIVFAHAIVGDRRQVERLEEQAIARCVRHGQTEQVSVYSFVITETEEEHLWRRTHR